jgi:[ribosomal protein S18]-alanine N-acetyltransferase
MSEAAFTFRPLTRSDAETIFSWRYPAPYEPYNLDARPLSEAIAPLLDPELRYYAVLDNEGELIAFRCFGSDAQVAGGDYSVDALDMGGGLRPDLTGRGLGRSVISAAMSFACQKFHPKRFRTTVASFNVRALRVCLELGYLSNSEFMRESDQRRFTVMMREA